MLPILSANDDIIAVDKAEGLAAVTGVRPPPPSLTGGGL